MRRGARADRQGGAQPGDLGADHRARAEPARNWSPGRSITAAIAPRRPLMEVNCSSFHENLLENELFGHERGAFTDASDTKKGLVELCDGGHAVPRRGGRHAAADPGQAAALHRPPQLQAGRRRAGHRGRHPHRRRDQQGPRERGARRAVPQRPLLPPQGGEHPPAAAARPRRRRAAAGAALPAASSRASSRSTSATSRPRRARAASCATRGRATCASCAT